MLMPRLQANSSSNKNNTHSYHKNNNDTYNNSSISGSSKRSHPAPITVAEHTKMRLLSKVEQNMRQQNQNQSVKKLINTAATGNGVVGDVDGLLTPLRVKQHASGKEPKPERNLWSREEMLQMLGIMQQIRAVELLNDRNVKSENVFKRIEEIMRSKGFVKKSVVQIWTKWKFLKSTYNTTQRQKLGTPKTVPEEVYRFLCKMLSSNANGDDGSECENSTNSLDGTADLSQHNQQQQEDGSLDNDSEMGVEHPIFGFRLGAIKPEPIDTGYETVINPDDTSERDTLDFSRSTNASLATDNGFDHTPFVLSVKNEPDMDLNVHLDGNGTHTPPPTAPTSPSATPSSAMQKLLATESNMFTSTPQLPPLRVASFAKDRMQHPTHGVLHIDCPIPQTLVKAAQHTGMRGRPLQTSGSINFAHPNTKLMLPTLQHPAARKNLPVRIPREISIQSTNTRNTAANNNAMRLKQVPMRQTAYALRPERLIPDLDQSISPPQSPNSNQPVVPTMLSRAMFGHPTTASTSRQAQMEAQIMQQRKRRAITDMPSPLTAKQQRNMSSVSNLKSRYDAEFGGNSEDEGDGADTADTASNGSTSNHHHGSGKGADEAQQLKQDEIFQKELSQLTSALYTAQSNMMRDFFTQQKEMARREHEFQLKQDTIVMRALRKQTDELLRTANDLIKQVHKVEKVEKVEPMDSKQSRAKLQESEIMTGGPQAEVEEQPEIELQEDMETAQAEVTAKQGKLDENVSGISTMQFDPSEGKTAQIEGIEKPFNGDVDEDTHQSIEAESEANEMTKEAPTTDDASSQSLDTQ
ncbi:uncharacterized protein LOC115620584 [Scaptodrosophila lebanonensis]|uniref:Uncharacterized protein LOC115620584 n=1 Tax=Drosophila lebanonensis TaxID=7225 RepID=A0A6J2SYU6_DROLE|nr:uncharacterized protein LOC115620584 [Scaptodrosophila lebanonensis]XP_030369750.1 uncharacterized protein LOC115620584 [Scaptodrosophila lebanonensis]XP_030369751.1 uncharacterized protein LOC115620584 [Scaptodrosophila lebanonensis]XP_030369752.1 uncharacterized protein LOC115620584 [Scaptodrosophila lebanonensis]